MIELGYPRICDDNNHHLGNAYLSSDFNIYENVWYPNGITEDDMENFRQLMNECVQLWMQWCAVTQSMLLYDEMIQRKSDGMSISVSEQNQYNEACQALENMCIN
jgi:hypothetical protein